jgi:hypothetical protein
MEQFSTIAFAKTKKINSLLMETKQLTWISRKIKLIETALEYLIKYQRRMNLISMAGKVQLNVNLNATRNRG